MSFEIRDRDAAARLGSLETGHGTVTTPCLLPVLNPNLETVTASDLVEEYGAQMVITNAYIIWKDEDLREEALREGVHGLLDHDGPVMTDSGTFQSYVYGEVDVDPGEIVSFQREIGTDVATILDVFSPPDRTRAEAEEDLEETLARARDARASGDSGEGTEGALLAIPIQGGRYPDLRERCAREARGLGDVYPIGGVVPLMERQQYATLVDVVVGAQRGLDPSRPVHLFGAGHPSLFGLAALLGCDLFDSASYAKFAQDGRLLTPEGTLELADLDEFPCPCSACSARTPQEVRDLPEEERVAHLVDHNLRAALAEVRRVREAIRRGRLWELVQTRVRSHPALADAYDRVLEHADWIEGREPTSKRSALFAVDADAVRRPEVRRFRRRVRERFPHEGRALVELPSGGRPVSRDRRDLVEEMAGRPVVPVTVTFLGPVPAALDETYPAAQSVGPGEPGPEARQALADLADAWDVDVLEDADPGSLPDPTGPTGEEAWLRDRTRAVLRHQMGVGAAEPVLEGDVAFETSKRTGRIRTVHVDGDHALSMRPRDGLFTLKATGAARLHEALDPPRLRVQVDGESVPFNRDGKSVFSKFVEEADPDLRPGDECLVVGPGDELAAVGRVRLTAEEMEAFDRGVACDVREGIPAPDETAPDENR